MAPIISLVSKLSNHYPFISFIEGEEYRWDPKNNSIHYNPKAEHAAEYLIHEVAHSILAHSTYDRDIQLIEMERDAWEKATHLGLELAITIESDVIDDSLDTYRDWLHARSLCPDCQSTGVQTDKSTYKCLACSAKWRVNEARSCQLRRYKNTK